MSGVPQRTSGCLLGPILFNIFVGVIDMGLSAPLGSLQSTKLSGAVDLLEGRECHPEGPSQA